jgi:hypothetical protein
MFRARTALSLLGSFLAFTSALPAQQSDDPQQRTLNALRSFAVHARVQLSDPAALPSIDESVLQNRLEDAIRQEGLQIQRSEDVRNGTQAEVELQYLVVAMPDSWGRPSSFAASSCIEVSQLVRLQRITPTGAPVYAVVPTWRNCGMLVGDKVSFSGTILRNADQQIARFISAWRRANAPRRAEPADTSRAGGTRSSSRTSARS